MSGSSAGLALLGFCGLSALGESAPVSVAHAPAVPRWAVFEVTMALSPQASRSFDETGGGPAGSTNPFEIPVVARFAPAAGGDARTVAGFYDGGGIFKARFSPPIEGNWTWSIESSFDPLDSLTGTVTVRSATVGSPGCPKTSAGKLGFAYPDGTSYNPVGTTCYAWVHQPEGDPLEEATLASLKASPFNKVRMTGFPKWYPFTHHEPRYYPFMGNFSAGNSSWDFTRPNPIFWQHFESRVQDVVALGIVPEIILFHPYDNGHWGFNAINKVCGKAGTPSASHCGNATADCLWCDENYIKYMVARVSAYGTWWSM